MMIHEITPARFDNQYRPQSPPPESFRLCYDKNTVLVKKNEDGTFDLPTFRELGTVNANVHTTSTYLFSIDGQTFYLSDMTQPQSGFTWESVRDAMNSNPRHWAFAAVTGYQLHHWCENRKYCGRCGTLTVKDEKIRALSCPSCKQMEFPKIAPAVIVGVTAGNRLLLASYPNYDKHALLAGFVEIGETLEETVRREVMEEVGLRVTNIRYYKSQPWSLSDNLLVGFFCDADASDKITFDAEELAGAEWFEREDIPLHDDYVDGSLTYEMMRQFKNGNV